MTTYNFITLGFDCSPASALQFMNLRKFALPFDWVVSNINSLEKCFSDNFTKYHTNLRLNINKTRVIDEYGFEYPHDYPIDNTIEFDVIHSDELILGEDKKHPILTNYMDFYDAVNEKYNRRIKRFLDIMNDPTPIIVLCRYKTSDVIRLKSLLKTYYNKENIWFVNSSKESYFRNNVININTEKNGRWNDTDIWKPIVDNICNNNIIPMPTAPTKRWKTRMVDIMHVSQNK